MGGNALKMETKDVTAETHTLIEAAVLEMIEGRNIKVATIPPIPNKDSFGNVSLIVEQNPNTNYNEIISELFSPNEISKNGHTFSFDYDGCQVDLIITPIELFDFSVAFHSYGDFGNIVGRIAHRLNLNFTYKGLFYKLIDKEPILLTRDISKALSSL